MFFVTLSRLIGPTQPITATAGEDITLPCHLVPGENVAAMTSEWTRPDLDPRFVFLWRAGQDLINMKNPSYKGRSSLFTDELKHGNISLKLSKVKPADEGRYRCYIPDKNEEAFIDLVVGAVSSPVISLSNLDKAISGVVLQCESAGWYPEPELLWLDGEGNLLSAGPTETLRGPDDLYTVSSRVTVEKRHSNNITCRVQQRNTNQNEYFQLNSSSAAPIIIGVVVSLALSIVLILIGVFFIWRRNKTSKTQINLPCCQNYYLKFFLQGLKQHTCKVINLFVLH
uniref:Ig-like domain-containing protein n=1 Tax=Haplochromis burtoni TaxID=8153 RepID=A0A3Q2VA69_HAPBU